ncbi:DUF4114 domain-containing protein [Corallococcus sp. M34]|uniref:DUF4114 domain-containing protein n=1 Tax=Citreicoccus inhibens TaxID=2849499 RepID=UPI001C235287|nr:DUF4114 domain-containing protein [Citreicoccus inhibens]MBU8896356.1 DUF4114 domain-containing protein [Citreicoccus inhibens]
MRTFVRALAALTWLVLPASGYAAPAKLCQDDLSQDRQPNFNAGDGSLQIANQTILVTGDSPPRLQLNTNLARLDPEHIYFPFDQHVTISYVYESAGASHALGYMYLDDLKARGYLDATGNLADTNNNGILDLHEDLFNLAPPSGNDIRPYIGSARRCTGKVFTSGGKTYTQPELAMKDCNSGVFERKPLSDARPGHVTEDIDVDIFGMSESESYSASDSEFSDNGLFPHIPNLLEPASVANGGKGLGKMVFLLADDDGDRTTYNNLSPVADSDDTDNGIPDYDVSKYDSSGLVRNTNQDPGITEFDRTVDLGQIQGGKEIVFFLVVYYAPRHNLDDGKDFPCLKRDPADGKCLLHLKTPISVFFSKAAWNLDQNFVPGRVTERNIGCSYDDRCVPDIPARVTSYGCPTVNPPGPKVCGWLAGPKSDLGSTLGRLKNLAVYGNLDMPMEKATLARPPPPSSGVDMNYMPHVIVGAPSTDPFRWILGFEDLSGGGDRDFNDVVFVVNKENGGGLRSATVSGDISPDIADDFTITKVRFKRQDDFAPAPRTCSGGAPCWTEEVAGACTPPSGVRPSIQYSVAVDCRVCSNGTCTPNANPQWIPVVFDPAPNNQVKELDIQALGFTGSQLCWKVDISSPNERCRPVIDNIDVGYQAVRSGNYARASPSTLGNAVVWGVNETPGRSWGQNWPTSGVPAAGTRLYDGSKDFTPRGHLYLQSLYDPENTDVTHTVQRWEAGRVMALSLAGSGDPSGRKLYTIDGANTRINLTQVDSGGSAATNPLFPDSLCDTLVNGRRAYDLNADGLCRTPSGTTADKKSTSDDQNDRKALIDWLYGWEDRYDVSPTSAAKRPWPFGGINLSTVALAVPPFYDTWYQNARPAERDLYRRNFAEPLKERPTIAYVGTMNGVFHAFNSGDFRGEKRDTCADKEQQRGFFRPTGTCQTTTPYTNRAYGTGEEKFAYLPRMLLDRYRNNYVQFPGSSSLPRPQVDASAAIANVDLGISNKPAWTPENTASRSTGAKTVLVSATGKNSPVVFSLDITNPTDSWYPLPMWEFSLADATVNAAFSTARATSSAVKLPDNTGSRHAPSVGRLAWGPTDSVWAAVVGTDYVPTLGRAGSVFLIDMKTGRPLNFGSTSQGTNAGVITLDLNSGVAAESALMDLDQDGTYDVIYVPTTAGHVYRINLRKVDTNAILGTKVQTCLVADAPLAAASDSNAAQNQDQSYQQLYSNLAVKLVPGPNGPAVRFFFGTGDNPDEFSDGPADKSHYRYHLFGYEDQNPTGTGGCAANPLTPMWVAPLDEGQAVWGGVAINQKDVFATTAVGKAADVCNLSDTESGKYYVAAQVPTAGTTPSATGTSLDGHGVNAPIVHDNHLFILTATGSMQIRGEEKWNNGKSANGATRSRILLWEPVPDGKLPQ